MIEVVLTAATSFYVYKALKTTVTVNEDPDPPCSRWLCVAFWPGYLAGRADFKEREKQVDKDLAELRVLIFSPEELELRGYGPDGAEATFRLIEAKKQLEESFQPVPKKDSTSQVVCYYCGNLCDPSVALYLPESKQYYCKGCAKKRQNDHWVNHKAWITNASAVEMTGYCHRCGPVNLTGIHQMDWSGA